MLIKKAPSRNDPNLDRNQKHTTVNEIMDETKKRKARKFKSGTNRTWITYEDGQYEKIFKK